MYLKKLLFFLLMMFPIFNTQAAAKISIFPVELTLWPEQAMSEVKLGNQGNQTVNLQVEAKTWNMDENGQFIETSTGNFTFYPRLLTIPPGEEKAVRIGYEGDFPDLEKSYRLYIQELPPIQDPLKPPTQGAVMGVVTLLRLSLPLFVSPTQTLPTPQFLIDNIAPTDKALRIGVRNSGQHHITLQKLRGTLLGSGNQSLTEGETNPGILRILPQRRIFVEVPLDVQQCSKTQTVHLQLTLEKLATVAEKSLSALGCRL